MASLFPSLRRPRRVAAGVLLLALFGGLVPVFAADELKQSTSLQFVPASSAFYATSLRLGEQWQMLAKSRAAAKLMSMKSVKLLHQGLADSPQAQLGLGMLQGEEIQEALALLGEMASDEIFIVGDAAVAKLPEAMNELQTAIQQAQLGGQPDFETIAPLIKKFQLPSLLIGFKVKTKARALDAMTKIQDFAEAALEAAPEVGKRFKRVKIAGGEFLTLQLDGSMIPWDEAPDAPGIEALKDALIKKTFTFTLGLRGDYVMIHLGPTIAGLEQLGKGPLLYDRPELARFRKYASEKIVGLSYVSEELAGQEDPSAAIGNLKNSLAPMLKLLEISDDAQEKIEKDIDALRDAVKGKKTKSGPHVGFSFMSPKGFTGYDEDWNEHPEQDGSKKLDILSHVGGSPLILSAGRSKYDPDDYKLLVLFVSKIYENVDAVLMEKLDEGSEEAQHYAKIKEVALPLVKRLDKATGTMLLPALRDGQEVFLIDGKLSSKQWHPVLPKSSKALPIYEPAIILGVSDAALLTKGVSEYVAVFNEVMSKLHEQFPDEVSDMTVPEPEVEKTEAGTYYSYPLEGLGLDKQLSPHAVVTKSMVVLTLSRQHADRLIKSTPLKVDGPAGQVDRPLSGVGHSNFAGVIDVIDAWVVYAGTLPQVKELLGGSDDEDAPEEKPEAKDEDDAPKAKPVKKTKEAAKEDDDDAPKAKPAKKVKDDDEDEDDAPKAKPAKNAKEKEDEADDEEDDEDAPKAKPARNAKAKDAEDEEEDGEKPSKVAKDKAVKEDEAEEGDASTMSPEDVIADIRTVLAVIKCARGYSSATYLEGKATVTHSEWYYLDLPK